MSDPTDPTTHFRHLAGDHARCRPGWCLAARHQHGQPTAETVPEPGEPAEPRCAVCDVSIVWTKHPDRDQSGWRHATDPGEPAHGAHPAGGVS